MGDERQDMGASVGEEWRAAPGFGACYLVSSLGRIRNVDTGRLLFGEVDRYGYRRVNLTIQGEKFKRKVHRLVCEAFHGSPPLRHEVGHLDNNKLNNCAKNLAWVTRSQNVLHNVAQGKHARANHPNAKLTEAQVAEIRSSQEAHRALARRIGVAEGTIRKIRKGDRW